VLSVALWATESPKNVGTEPYIESVFENELAALDAAGTLAGYNTLLEATIIEADPLGAEQQAAQAAQERFVRLGRTSEHGLSEHGLKLIIARATAGDAIWFEATIDRIADILTRRGDDDPIDVRRSKAIGILAPPAQALQLLRQHQDDNGDGSAEPSDPAEEPACEEAEASRQDADSDNWDPPTDTDQAAHQSLQLTPPPFHPNRPRPAPSSMPTSTKKPYAPAPASPGSKTSAPCCRTGSPPHSVITAPST
jgi:hypothetical protein